MAQRKYLRLSEVLAELDHTASKATVYRWCAKGSFPRPVRLSPGRSVWLAAEVERWQADRVAERSV